MPLTSVGKRVFGNMKKQYGDEKGKEVFYASINDNKPGSEKWHNIRKKPSRRARQMLGKR